MKVKNQPQGSTYEPPAPAGSHVAVLCDVLDLGNVTQTWNDETVTKHMLRLVWQIDEVNPETRQRYTASERVAVTLHEKATLYKRLNGWLAGDESVELDAALPIIPQVAALIGRSALVTVVHKARTRGDGPPFANIGGVGPLPKGLPGISIEGYTRVGASEGDDDLAF